MGCVAFAAPDALLLVDPLVPKDPWPSLESLVAELGKPVVVFTTLQFHRRSRDEVLRRFGGIHARGRASLPEGVEAVRIRRAGETMIWLPGPRALVPGDRLLGDEQAGLRVCPESWLRYLKPGLSLGELRAVLRPLLDLPVELVLVSHGEPILADGRAAVQRALS